jgi:hippurate hydrolase
MVDRLTLHRRTLHRIPELDHDLLETRKYLLSVMARLPFEIVLVGRASFCAFLNAGREGSIAFRSDMDALPITERTGAEYASTLDGCMHACGHDAHMAILLTFAEEISLDMMALPHNVLLVFQAAEETGSGAREICESRVFQRYNVSKIFGLHVWPGFPSGSVVCESGGLMAAAATVSVDISGNFTHVASADKCVDVLYVGTKFIDAAYEMERGELPPEAVRLLTFSVFQCGTVDNIISGRAILRATLRYFDEDIQRFLSDRLRNIARELDAKYGSGTDVVISEPCPPVINEAGLFKDFERILIKADAGFQLMNPEKPSMAAEDFSYYQREIPGLYFFLGIGETPPLHSDRFDFDEGVLVKGVEVFKLVLNGIE